MDELREIREANNGKLPAFTRLGGYPIIYLTADQGCLCPECANGEHGSEAFIPHNESAHIDHSDRQWAIVGSDVHWEGEPVTCDHCNGQIESAYGVPDEE